jgi:hypothetical protein
MPKCLPQLRVDRFDAETEPTLTPIKAGLRQPDQGWFAFAAMMPQHQDSTRDRDDTLEPTVPA